LHDPTEQGKEGEVSASLIHELTLSYLLLLGILG